MTARYCIIILTRTNNGICREANAVEKLFRRKGFTLTETIIGLWYSCCLPGLLLQ